MSAFIVQKHTDRRGWFVHNEYGLQCYWGPFFTRRAAVRFARKLKRREDTPKVRV